MTTPLRELVEKWREWLAANHEHELAATVAQMNNELEAILDAMCRVAQERCVPDALITGTCTYHRPNTGEIRLGTLNKEETS